jgi:hypothetical protein
MNVLWIKNGLWVLVGTALGLALVYVVKTYVTHTPVAWDFLWGYPLTVVTAYVLMGSLQYLRCRRRG